jgi:tRNA G18 (ribose-2'-O)-methylase SpoU
MKLLNAQEIQLVRKKSKSSNAPILVFDNMQYPENIASIFRLSDAMILLFISLCLVITTV